MFATRWKAFPSLWNEFGKLQHQVERAFGPAVERAQSGGSRLPINAWEDSDKLFVEAELPGLNLETLEITVEGGNDLLIKGDRVRPQEDTKWHRQERPLGEFSRSLRLPFDVDVEKVVAHFKNGVLSIELPKREEDKPRRIEVKVD